MQKYCRDNESPVLRDSKPQSSGNTVDLADYRMIADVRFNQTHEDNKQRKHREAKGSAKKHRKAQRSIGSTERHREVEKHREEDQFMQNYTAYLGLNRESTKKHREEDQPQPQI